MLALASSGLLLANLMWLWAIDSTSPTLHFISKVGMVFTPTSDDLVNTE